MRQPEGLERSESSGIGLRAFVGDRMATASSSDTGKQALSAELYGARRRGWRSSRRKMHSARSLLKELLAQDVPDLDLFDAHEPEAAWLQEQCAKAEDTALATKGITNSEGADASTGSYRFTLATSNGFAKSYRTSHSSISISVLAGEGWGWSATMISPPHVS